ncbi:hypothetical protein PS880_03130 [Pseudomonas fluorescens]|uniref:Uncharacterized protein n=1 Tax=Pseudomonas fluorescens TaxID=294 RepID=A0A5E7KYX5_PSEFL|nr:hypothetical protein PS880_03130 [Pseudomonas fluorescens]
MRRRESSLMKTPFMMALLWVRWKSIFVFAVSLIKKQLLKMLGLFMQLIIYCRCWGSLLRKKLFLQELGSESLWI